MTHPDSPPVSDSPSRGDRADSPSRPSTAPTGVLHLVQGLQVGGLEMMVVQLLLGLDRERYTPQVCCFDDLGPLQEPLREQGIPVHRLPRRAGVDLRYPIALAGLVRRLGARILHLHNPTALFYGAPAGRMVRGLRTVYTEHGRDYSRGLKARLANRVLSRLVDRIVVLSDPAREYLTMQEGMPAGRMEKIYNGIDPAPFSVPYDARAIRDELGLGEGRPVLGIIGRLDPIKNHAVLFRALRLVLQRYPDAVLLVIGDGPERSDLEAQVVRQGLGQAVRFLGTRKDVPRLFAVLELLILPSFSEGLSITLIEACAAGIPIVATDVGGNREVARDGLNGLLVPSDDHQALARAIMELAADPQRAAAMGRAGRGLFTEHFSLEGMVSRYQDLYGRLLPLPFSRGAQP